MAGTFGQKIRREGQATADEVLTPLIMKVVKCHKVLGYTHLNIERNGNEVAFTKPDSRYDYKVIVTLTDEFRLMFRLIHKHQTLDVKLVTGNPHGNFFELEVETTLENADSIGFLNSLLTCFNMVV